MTQSGLAGWLIRIALEADAAEKRALIIQCLSPVIRSANDPADGTVTGLVPPGRHEWKIEGARIKEVVKDRSIIMVAWKNACSDRLQIEPCRKAGEDGVVADGLLALIGERPLLSLVAINDDTIELQIGGFDKSAVGHTGNLMDLSRQVIDIGKAR